MTPLVRTLLTLLIAIAGLHTLGGCASRAESRSFEIPAGRYPDAIIATRDTLRAAGYTLERIDAASGEISTTERTVAGLAAPFAKENRTLSGLAADTLTDRPRTVRVRFRDARDPLAPPRADAPVRAEIDAMIWKRVNPGWRVETETSRRNLVSRDPAERARGVSPSAHIPVRRDDAFARLLVERITNRLARPATSDAHQGPQPDTGSEPETTEPAAS